MARKVAGRKGASKKTPIKAVRVLDKAEAPLTTQERKALDEAVSFVNTRLDKSAASLIEIGEYLLSRFFAGDPEKVHDRAPRKGVSLRKLAEHPDILMSFPQLSRAVALAVQETQLSSVSTSKHLTASHKILLAAIENNTDLSEKDLLALKKRYIALIERDELSVREFHDLLIKDRYARPRGLAAVEDEAERKLLRSGFQSIVNPFREILELNLDRLFEMPEANIKNAYNAIIEARKKMDAIIREVEGRMK